MLDSMEEMQEEYKVLKKHKKEGKKKVIVPIDTLIFMYEFVIDGAEEYLSRSKKKK